MFKVSDLSLARNLSEVNEYVRHVINETDKCEELKQLARIRGNEFFRRFFIEYYPFYVHVNRVKYNKKAKFIYNLGNQGYDFEVYMGEGLLEYIEITYPHDGELEVKQGEEINKNGFCEEEDGDQQQLQNQFIKEVIASLKRNKENKDYTKCTLVILINPHKYFDLTKDSDLNKLNSLKNKIKDLNLYAKRIYLYIQPTRDDSMNYLDIYYKIKE